MNSYEEVKKEYKKWMDETLEEGFAAFEKEKQIPGWFSIAAIQKVPYIHFPYFTKEENDEFHTQVKNVLRISRNENHYKEVAITYNKEEKGAEKIYRKVLGDENSVLFIGDKETKKIIQKSNKEKMIVVSIHNHPNDTGFSIQDMFVFSQNIGITLMAIVNTQGEISFLYNPDRISTQTMFLDILADFVPDFRLRKNFAEKENPQKVFQIKDLLTQEEQQNIISFYKEQIRELGIYQCEYINQEKAKELYFYKKETEEKKQYEQEQENEIVQSQTYLNECFETEVEEYGNDEYDELEI